MKRDASKAGRWRWLSGAVLVLLVGVLAFMVSQGSGAASHSFDPDADIELSSYDSDDNADITTTFGVDAPDVNFDVVVTFTPSECEGGLPGFYVAADADVPDGTVVGELHSMRTLSTVLDVCYHTLPVNFTMVDATADIDNYFDSTGDIGSGTWNGFDDVGGLDRAVVEYPGFLRELYPGVEPRARYYGKTFVGMGFNLWVSLMFLVFEPGECPAGNTCPAAWGYSSVTVLNNPAVPAAPSALGDFCTPQGRETTIFGLADGIPLRINPPCGSTCIFRNWSRGLPDADGDGYENAIDTCPFDFDPPPDDPNTEDPRQNRGPDNDAINSSCDPDPNAVCGPGLPGDWIDCDFDWYYNTADNCPLVKNGPMQDNQADADNDGIGDACDPNPNTMDGVRPTKTIEMPVDISGPPPPPVGGIVEIQVDGSGSAVHSAADSSGGSSRRNYIALAGLTAAALVTLSVGARYARRRWLR